MLPYIYYNGICVPLAYMELNSGSAHRYLCARSKKYRQMNELILTKSSSESDLKRYFTAVLELSKSDNKFPINLDEVWMLVYNRRDNAIRELRKSFFENEDFQVIENQSLPQNEERVWGGQNKVNYFLSLSCLEYFIARKVRPVFEVYRQVFHKSAATPALPTTYKEALTQLLAQVEQNEKLQAEVNTLAPKGRIYDQVISNADNNSLYTTRQVAQEIGMTDRQLFSILLQLNILYKQSETYMIGSDYVQWGMHQMVSHVINDKTHRVRTYLKWTLKGRAYIHALYDTNWDKRRAWHLLKNGNELQTINA